MSLGQVHSRVTLGPEKADAFFPLTQHRDRDSMPAKPLPFLDLEHIVSHTLPLWSMLDGQRLFITGGTGFFGTWLLESLIHARQSLGLDLQATVLSRTPDAFLARFPHLARHPALNWLSGQVQDFVFPQQKHHHIIHAATETYARTPPSSQQAQLDTLLQGTRRVLEFAHHTQAENILITSSGAIYGRQPPNLTHIPENHSGGPDCTDTAMLYAEGKRCTELLAALHAKQCDQPVKIGRCFAFVGPHLPLDKHFAVGNFINDVLHDRDIHIQGDGTPLRSYLHAADLVIWLLTILLQGQSMRPYNVGSDNAISIFELARRVANSLPGHQRQVFVAHPPEPDTPPARYVPDISRAHEELGLTVRIPLDDAIRRSLAWYLQKSS